MPSIDWFHSINCYCAYLGFTLTTTIKAPCWSLLCITAFTGQRKKKEQHANACNLETDMVITTYNKPLCILHVILYCIIVLYKNQRTLEETSKRGHEIYNLNSCLSSAALLLFTAFFECTGIKVCLITSLLVKPSSRTLLVQTPQLTYVSPNRIPDISLHSSSPYDERPHPW